MFDRIQSMINENNLLLAQAYAKIADKLGGDDDEDLKEVASLLKINEIVLMELKEKQSFNNEKTVLNSLTDMHKAIVSTLIELDN